MGHWRLSSLLLEDILTRHEGVLEAAVFGVPDDNWGERAVAFVVPNPSNVPLTEESLRTHFDRYVRTEQLPKYGIPSGFLIVDSLDKTSVGKLDKKRLRKRALG